MKNSNGSMVFSFTAGLQATSAAHLLHPLLYLDMAEPKKGNETLLYTFIVESSGNVVIFISCISSYKSAHKKAPPA